MNLAWLKVQHFVFPKVLEYHGLQKLVVIQDTFYPELVKVFYKTIFINGERDYLCAIVKGKFITMSHDLWKEIDGLSDEGMITNEKGLQDVGVKFNKLATYKIMMKNPKEAPKGKTQDRFGSGALKMEARLLAYVIAQIITPKGSNHAQLTKKDLLLIYLMQRTMKINWVNIVMENMLKTKQIGTFQCPCVVLISRILDHFKVDVTNEIENFVELEYELKIKVLKQMRYIEVDDGSGWIEKLKDTPIEDTEEKPMTLLEMMMMMMAKMDKLLMSHQEEY